MKLFTEEKQKFEDLSWMIGMNLELVKGPWESHAPDGRVRMIADYPETILVEMEYVESKWGLTMPARWIRLQIPKASLYCGDVVLKIRSTREIVTGDLVREGATR